MAETSVITVTHTADGVFVDADEDLTLAQAIGLLELAKFLLLEEASDGE